MSAQEQVLKQAGDVVAAGTVVGAFVINNMPTLAVFMGVLWYAVQIFVTLRNHFRRKRGKRTRRTDEDYSS